MFKNNSFYDIRRYVRKIRGFTLEGVVEVLIEPAEGAQASVQSMYIAGSEPQRDILDIVDRNILSAIEKDISDVYNSGLEEHEQEDTQEGP